MRGLQFLNLIAKIKGKRLSEELFQWLKATQLDHYCDVEFRKMSYGTRRKFNLSTALIGNPKLLLLDEPFNGLDKNTINYFIKWLKIAKKRSCILLVTHDTHLVESLKDSIIKLD